jgi:hypothetical protein
VSITDRLFGRPRKAPKLPIAEIHAWMTEGVSHIAGRAAEMDLVQARLADRCRDSRVEPLTPEEFEKLTADLDAESCRRLALLVHALEVDKLRQVLPTLIEAGSLNTLVEIAFIGPARQSELLTLELLRQSPLRVEELTRRFFACLGVEVQGESAETSRRRLERLDYGRLLEEAKRAEAAAAERMEQLRQLQEEHRPRRGKW